MKNYIIKESKEKDLDFIVDKLVEYMNIELKNNPKSTVNKLADKLGIKQSTFKTWVHRAGYQFDFDNRCYTKVTQKDKALEEVAVTKEIEQSESLIQSLNKDINISSLKELVSLIEPIKEVIQKYNESRNIIDVKPIELNPKSITDIKQKLFKVDKEVLEKWEKFVAEHKQYKVQNLVSMALEEFIDKYK